MCVRACVRVSLCVRERDREGHMASTVFFFLPSASFGKGKMEGNKKDF